MENIGLYLTPKPLLQNPRQPIPGFASPKSHNTGLNNDKNLLSTDNPINTTPNTHPVSSQWEYDLVLEWPYNDNEDFTPSAENQQSQKMIVGSPDNKSVARSQQSLLSYLPNRQRTMSLSDGGVSSHLPIANRSGEMRKDALAVATESALIEEFDHLSKFDTQGEPCKNQNLANTGSTPMDDYHTKIPNQEEDYTISRPAQYRKEHDSLDIPSQSEFMKQMNLLNTPDRGDMIVAGDSLMSPITPSKLKLWNPDRDSTSNTHFQNQSNDEMWKNMLEGTDVESGKS